MPIKIKKAYDKSLKIYLEVEFELKEYFKLFVKLKYKKGMTCQEYLNYQTETYQKRKQIDSILKRLRIRLQIISIMRYI